jgi:transposase, IS6 family
VIAVRWYLRYGLSYRDVEELLAERGIEVDHVTVYRWVQRFTPLLVDAARPCRHVPGDRWFVDETSWESQGVAARILRVGPAGCGLSRWRGDRCDVTGRGRP